MNVNEMIEVRQKTIVRRDDDLGNAWYEVTLVVDSQEQASEIFNTFRDAFCSRALARPTTEMTDVQLIRRIAEIPCSGCGVDLKAISEVFYMLRDDVWMAVAKSHEHLCISCVEQRLKRRLTKDDFQEQPANTNILPHSQLLRQRLEI